MRATIYVGDVLDRLRELPENSVQCVVTSPPYWGLRDYGCEGQIGLEPTPREFIAKMTEVFAGVRRVLRADGTCWVNMGDSYARNGGTQGGGTRELMHMEGKQTRMLSIPPNCRLKEKDMVGMPWRLAFALQEDGWWLRQDIIWSKPNPMPESVTDRCTKAHEYVFLLTKSARYFYDAEAVKEAANGWNGSDFHDGNNLVGHPNVGKNRGKGNAKTFRGGVYVQANAFENSAAIERDSHGNSSNGRGTRNKRSVWEIATEGYAEAHFATFPTKLVEPCILAGTKPGDVVLDPFCGSGTTGLVAMRYQRDFVGIELNPEYARMAERRIGDEIPLFTGVEVIGLRPMAVVNG